MIGAGIAGLSCARRLTQAGHAVTVFDKGRGVAGRTSTRRVDGEPARGWDHGATCFLAEEAAFLPEVARWLDAGVVAPWPIAPAAPGEEELDAHTLLAPGFSSSWVGVPSMSAIARFLSEELVDAQVLTGQRVTSLEQAEDGWQLTAEQHDGASSRLGPYDELVVTAPPVQSRALLADLAPDLAELLFQVWMQPCWTLLAVSEAVDDPPAIRRIGPGHLPDGVSTLSCEDSKPGRLAHPAGLRWILHTTAGWAQQHLEEEVESVLPKLRALAEQAIGVPLTQAQAHRWRYARVHRPLGRDCVRDASARLTLAGDFCRGDGVEHAWLSGLAAAESILSTG
ncbi:MAG: hypothetical protein CMJ94_09615 [Planctomycetes bacterium]|nr:hypothetical protein [Planctomycetota bacterium]